jgi:PPM family protein phosphatase
MIPGKQAHLQVAAITDPGRSGKNNEDRYGVSAFILSEQDPTPVVLAIVADGIGGHHAGEIASELAVEHISRLAAESNGSEPIAILQGAITSASQEIFARTEKEPDLHGMGTTCACCWVAGDRLYATNVGDSRIYWVRQGAIRQLSTDHTWIQEALDVGLITPEQVAGHPNQHVLRRHLGGQEAPQAEVRLRLDPSEDDSQAEANQGMKLLEGDQLLLCSDGLTDLVKPEEILAELKNANGKAALERLVGLANQRGGHDNITIILLRVPGAAPIQAAAPARKRKPFLTCLILSIIALAVLGVILGSWLFKRSLQPVTAPENTPAIFTTLPAALPSATTDRTALIPTQTTTLVFGQPTPLGVESNTTPAPSTTVQSVTLTPWPTNTP